MYWLYYIWIVRLSSTTGMLFCSFWIYIALSFIYRLILLYNITIPYRLPLLFFGRVTVPCIYRSILLPIYLWFTSKSNCCSLGLLLHGNLNCCFFITVINNCYAKTQITTSLSIDVLCVTFNLVCCAFTFDSGCCSIFHTSL